MVLSVQKKLLLYVDEHLASYLEDAHLLSTQFSTIPHSLEMGLALLASQFQQKGVQCHLQAPYPLSTEHTTIQPSYTLLLCHSYSPHITNTQKLEDCAIFLAALDAYQHVAGPLPIRVQCLLVDSETTPAENEAPDACLWYHDPEIGMSIAETPVLALGTKGLLHVELEIQTASTSIDAMHGGIAPDPLWRLLWALNSVKDAREDILIEGFYDTLAPAQDDTIDHLHLLPDITTELIQRWGIQQPLMGLHGFQLRYAHLLLPTCTVTHISNEPQSISTNAAIPQQAKAQLLFYLVPDQDPHDIFLKLQQHLQSGGFSDLHLRLLSSSPPSSTPISNPFVQQTIHATEAAYGQKPFLLPTTIGSYQDLGTGRTQGAAPTPHSLGEPQIPIVFIPRNMHNREKDFANRVKQILLLIEGMSYANDTTE